MPTTRSKTYANTMASTSGKKRTKMSAEERREANRLAQQKRRANPKKYAQDKLYDLIKRHEESDVPLTVDSGIFDRLAENLEGISAKAIYNKLNAIRKSKGFPPIKGKAKEVMESKDYEADVKKTVSSSAPAPTRVPANNIDDTRSEVGSIDGGDEDIDSSNPTISGPMTLAKLYNRPGTKGGVRLYKEVNHQKGVSTKNQVTEYLEPKAQNEQVNLFYHALKHIFQVSRIDFEDDIVEMMKKKFNLSGDNRISLKDDIFFPYITTLRQQISDKPYGRGSYNKLISPWSKAARIFKKFRDLFSDDTSKVVSWVKKEYTNNKNIETVAIDPNKTLPAMVKALNKEILAGRAMKAPFKTDKETKHFMDNLILLSLKVTNPPLRNDEADILMLDTEDKFKKVVDKYPKGKFYVRESGRLYIGETAKTKGVSQKILSDHTQKVIEWVERNTGRRTKLITPEGDMAAYANAVTDYSMNDFRHAWTTYLGGSDNKEFTSQDKSKVASAMNHTLETASANYDYSATIWERAPTILMIDGTKNENIKSLVKNLKKKLF